MNALYSVALLGALTGTAWADGMSCEDLTKMSLPHAEVTSAVTVAKGAYTPMQNPLAAPPTAAAGTQAVPGVQAGVGGAGGPGSGQNSLFSRMPAFCDVKATLRPVTGSEIKIDLWIPSEGWNGNFAALGNGGFSTNFDIRGMAGYLVKGYATAATDTGRTSDEDTVMVGHLVQFVDYEYRAVHEMAVASKLIVAQLLGSKPKRSFFTACSTGGRQALVEAEYFPEDFDGIVAGAASNPMTRIQAGGIWAYLALNKDEASYITVPKWAAVHRAVLDECDAKDGLKDGLIEDPRKCSFDMNTLLCKSGDADNCLTAPQLEALKKVVAGPVNPRTKEQITPGYPVGTPMEPQGGVANKNKIDRAAITLYKALYQDANWDPHTFDFDKDLARAEDAGDKLNADHEELLKNLFARGGKVIIYTGWDDPTVSPLSAITYYEKAIAANSGATKGANSIRLFLPPGMGHCGAGDGPNSFDTIGEISKWVESGEAPESIVFTQSANGKVIRSRPVCSYPQVARYKGTGSVDEAQNFVCTKP